MVCIKYIKRIVGCIISIVMMVSLIMPYNNISTAAKKPALNKKNAVVWVGSSVT